MKILSMIMAIVAILFTGCQKGEISAINMGDGEVAFTSGIATRASGTTWDVNDEIGVFMTENGSGGNELNTNVMYSNSNAAAGATATFTSTPPIYYPVGAVDFLAYYPYKAGVAKDNYAVDVTTQTPLTAIDLMTATKTAVSHSLTAPMLQFSHKLSNIIIHVVAGDDLEANDLAKLTVVLVGTKATATYNLSTDGIDFSGVNATPITLTTSTDGSRYEGIVIPQELSGGVKLKFTTQRYGTFKTTITTAKFAAEKTHKYTATINRDGVSLSGGTLSNWTGDSYVSDDNLTADLKTPPTYPTVKVGTYYISVYDRNCGADVPHWAEVRTAENWKNGDVVGKPLQGTGNPLFRGEHYLWTDIFTGVDAHKEGVVNQDENPCFKMGNGWRVPTETELTTIKGKMAGLTLTGENNVTCYFPLSGYTSGRESYSRGYYWSTKETDSNAAKYLYLGASPSITSASKNHGFSVRCVKDASPPPPTYPTVKIGNTHSIYVYDRNCGDDVPNRETVSAANNFISPNTGDRRFQGAYYTWEEAKSACPSGWRLPTETELGVIASKITHSNSVATLTGENSITCYFPLSGIPSSPYDKEASYWSGTEYNGSNAWHLSVYSTYSGTIDNSKSFSFSVRCVKTVTP